jgi:hypothetical protein
MILFKAKTKYLRFDFFTQKSGDVQTDKYEKEKAEIFIIIYVVFFFSD